jgi:hypothetical protein
MVSTGLSCKASQCANILRAICSCWWFVRVGCIVHLLSLAVDNSVCAAASTVTYGFGLHAHHPFLGGCI